MISKHVHCLPSNDNFQRLARYVFGITGVRAKAYAFHDQRREKTLYSWCEGCINNDDFELAVREISDTQAGNYRSGREKSYHLIVSFRAEDAPKLTESAFRDIERRFAEALGYAEHQRICGVHRNTEHLHLHIAYNMIDPERYTRKEPYRDYLIRDTLCRQLEIEYGLSVDNGRDRGTAPRRGNEKSQTMEAQTGRQSFLSWSKELSGSILTDLKSSTNWQDVHIVFARHGMKITLRGSGMVIGNRYGRQYAKASEVNRLLSSKRLIERFGEYRGFYGSLPESEIRYNAAPLQRSPHTKTLWKEYCDERSEVQRLVQGIRDTWKAKRISLDSNPLGKKERARLKRLTRQHEALEIFEARKGNSRSWIDFLKGKAIAGDENALAVLRSREQPFSPELPSPHDYGREAFLKKKLAISQDTTTSFRTKKRLLAISTMSYALGHSQYGVRSDGRGTLIFTLPDGGIICDDGRKITFSDDAQNVARRYMLTKGAGREQTVEKELGTFLLQM